MVFENKYNMTLKKYGLMLYKFNDQWGKTSFWQAKKEPARLTDYIMLFQIEQPHFPFKSSIVFFVNAS